MKGIERIMMFIFLVASLLFIGFAGGSPAALAAGDVTTGYSKLGVNIESLSDWSAGHMFVDAMKTSRRWGSPGTPWDESSPIDASGWPTTDAGVVVFTTASASGINAYDISGTYRLSFEGTANIAPIACSFSVINKLTSNGITTADIVVPTGQNILMMSFTGTGNGVRNVKLIRPGYSANTTQTFTTDFLNALKPFSTIRFMDYLDTNSQNNLSVDPWYDTSPVLWSNRRLPSDASQGSNLGKKIGGSWEYVIELANLTGKNIWINVPYNADSGYILSLAQMLKNNIRPDVNIYIELSNEVWNWQFQQAQLNLFLAQSDTDARGNYWFMYAKQVVLMSNVFKTVFGSSAMNNQIRVILGTQIGAIPSDYWPKQMLDFINLNFGDPSQIIYSLAGAPYIEEPLPVDSTSIQVVLDSFIKSSDSSVVGRSKLIALAKSYNLAGGASSYEGGVGPQAQVDTNLATRIAANRDPAMQAILVRDIQKNWIQIGGGLFMYFSLSSPYSKYGCWGLTENIRDLTTPKYQGIVQVSNFNSANIGFEDLAIGIQPSSVYPHSSGITFQNFYSPNSSPDLLQVRGISDGFASNVLFSQNWSSRIEVTRSGVYDQFDLESFDYTGDPWNVFVVDATITGLKADGRIFTSTISTNTKQHQTKVLNWTNLKKLTIDYHGGVTEDYGGLDNFKINYYTMAVPPTPNNAPVAQAQAVRMAKDTAEAITLTATDLDGDPLTYTVVYGPANGTLTGTAPNLTYTPAANYTGSDSFTFKANDGLVDSNTATVTINVTTVSSINIGFEDLTIGVQPSSVYTHSSGITFQNFFGSNSNPDLLQVRGTNEGFASNVLFPQNWSSRIEITRNGAYDQFDLQSFDYTGDPWNAYVTDATVTGLKADGSILTSTFSTNTKQNQTLTLNWTRLKKLVIDYRGGVTEDYGGLDNFKINYLQ